MSGFTLDIFRSEADSHSTIHRYALRVALRVLRTLQRARLPRQLCIVSLTNGFGTPKQTIDSDA